ncbi:MAG TPA: hypothetical protein VFA27_10770 [Vicinamibacterales bacterium]|nr:hypothetical protein [Vicinamibacterales bacterium]
MRSFRLICTVAAFGAVGALSILRTTQRVTFAAGQGVAVLTHHNDTARTGQNLSETILTPSNVNVATFGKVGFLAVDGKVDAQPLYQSSVPIPLQGVHDVVYVATEHGSLYAFDAQSGVQLWRVSLLGAGETPSDNRSCGQVTPEIGITSTPVIDPTRGTQGVMYAVAMSKSGTIYHHRLHAIDVTTGAEMSGSPVEIRASVPGTGAGSANGVSTFDPKQYKDRAALLLLNGIVYTSWASHCDIGPYGGWIIGYDASTLAQRSVRNITANGQEGAFWSAGGGPAADPAGDIYVMSGNGTFDTTLDARGFPSLGDFGNAFIALTTPSLAVRDYFTPFDTVSQSAADLDLGAGGPVVLPDLTDATGTVRHLVIGGGKDQRLYLLDRSQMGKWTASRNNIYQELTGVLPSGLWSIPAYFNQTVFIGAVGDAIKAFAFSAARLGTTPTSQTPRTFAYPGATPSVSANGLTNAIVWAAQNTNPAALAAYDARNLTRELYHSSQGGTRDQFGAGNKFITPTIANGRVFVASQTGVGVFGLLTGAPGAPSNLRATVSGGTLTLTWTAPTSGGAPTSYVIDAGVSPGFSGIGAYNTGSTATTFSAPASQGAFYFRVRGQNSNGVGPASNEVSVLNDVPQAPSNLRLFKLGSLLIFQWNAPTGGPAPTSYVLEGAATPDFSVIGSTSVGASTTYFVTVATISGTVYARVRAANASGVSAPSNAITVVVP